MLNTSVAVAIAVVSYALILTERVPRVVAALAGAVAMVLAGIALGFYSERQALDAVDFNTLALLAGLMVFVSLFKRTGAFEAMALWLTRLTRANPVRLLAALSLLAALLSTVVNNVTVILFMVPITLTIAASLGLSPVPFILAEALFSNIGGVATLIGDPPNVLIGSAAGLGFVDFLVNLGPIVLGVSAASLAVVVGLFRGQLRAAGPVPPPAAAGAVKSPANLKRLLWVLSIGMGLFFFADVLGLSPGLVALLIAAASLLWVRSEVEEIVAEIEWPLMVLFAALFVIVGGLEAVGALEVVAEAFGRLAQADARVAAVALLWLSALFSAVIDNIPFTVVMIPILQHLQAMGVDGAALWWALALGVGLGGNATPLGSTAGLFVISFSARTRLPIRFGLWVKTGGLVTLVGLAVATLMMLWR